MTPTAASPDTPFTRILQSAIDTTPGAIGGSFAASDGETVDLVASGWTRGDWELLTAHHGIILAHARAALRTFHYGDPTLMVVSHRELHILMSAVADGYFALLAIGPRAPLDLAVENLGRAADYLRAEIQ
jgi:predicted regulator of Ras-like GTPase activity (Roadblock/LC7/MglB family)